MTDWKKVLCPYCGKELAREFGMGIFAERTCPACHTKIRLADCPGLIGLEVLYIAVLLLAPAAVFLAFGWMTKPLGAVILVLWLFAIAFLGRLFENVLYNRYARKKRGK